MEDDPVFGKGGAEATVRDLSNRAVENRSAGEAVCTPAPSIALARQYLEAIGGGDVAHTFQPYHDQEDRNPKYGWMRQRVHGRLDIVWDRLMQLQLRGAAIAVTMADTDGMGRKTANMVRPRCVWIEADKALPRELRLMPTIAVESSPCRYHFIYVARDLDWPLWHGVQQTLIVDYGSDPHAALRTQVLRLPGTLHLKDPALPHLVRIVEHQTTWCVHTAAEIAKAFPPRVIPARRAASTLTKAGAPDWQPDRIVSAFKAIDRRLQSHGPFIAQGDRPDDQPIRVDWSDRDWWLRATACLHHASGGSDAGFAISCAVSGGNRETGLVGRPAAFDADDQRRVWDTLSSTDMQSWPRGPVTIRTIYWVAQHFCGWSRGPGRPFSQPVSERPISNEAQQVMEAGRRTLEIGLERMRSMHGAVYDERLRVGSLKHRIVSEVRSRLHETRGFAAISSLGGFADTLGCSVETLRKYLRKLASVGILAKNEGNSTSGLGTSGITIALLLPAELTKTNDALSRDTPDFHQTGISTPNCSDRNGQPSSRSLTSQVGDGGRPPISNVPGEPKRLHAPPKPLTLGDWIEMRVIHDELAEHLERVADAYGKSAVSRVLVRLEELLEIRRSFAAVRLDAERAGDIAARRLVKRTANGIPDRDRVKLIDNAIPASVPGEDSRAFVRAMAQYLDLILREAKGEVDPWRRRR
jgi:RepB DNA-primase N-terminal domain